MKEITEYEKDLASIRSIMERSVKFISLSGLSGVLSGIYALAGAAYAYSIIYYPLSLSDFINASIADRPASIFKLEVSALLVLIASIGTGILMSHQKAKKLETSLWNATSQQLLTDILFPLCSGGFFILILLSKEYYLLLAPSSLIFYGLVLIQSSRHTYREILYLGIIEIALGLVSAILPGYGLIFWAVGFGVMHIIYGALMYFRYDK
ncbi:hypothetical protein WSM22_05480 [Cytophagales bacterium WSM2-2]|nr:hypothetical protein WSM22_05480 [Cytophagales bacterium WSM2-2]